MTSIVRELQGTGENFAEIRHAHARIEKLLQVIALAVIPARLTLSVWGYKGSTACKSPGWETRGRLLDAAYHSGTCTVWCDCHRSHAGSHQMSTRTAPRATNDANAVSPKVKASLVGGAARTLLTGMAAAFITAIPGDTFDGLGLWAAPVDHGLSALAAALTACAKLDPARRPNLLQDTNRGVYTDLADLEAQLRTQERRV